MKDSTIKLKVNGKEYEGWLSVSISSSLQSLARTFSVSTAIDRKSNAVKDIEIGDAVEVYIGEDKVLTGYVTQRSISLSERSLSVSVSGASKTIDLEQCSLPDGSATSYKSQTHATNLKSVCSPYGIEVVDEVKNTTKCDFEIKPTDKIGDAIVDYLKKHGLLVGDDEEGRLVIRDIGSGGTVDNAITEGSYVTCSRKRNADKIFSEYVMVGQSTNATSELSTSANQSKAVEKNASVTRPRTQTVQVSGNVSATSLRKRVAMQRDVSIGASDSASFTMTGWRQQNGDLWKINQLVKIQDDVLGLDVEWLITSVNFEISNGGTLVSIDCQSPLAFKNCVIADDTKAKAQDFSDIKSGSGNASGTSWTKS